ncbi:hypothetical protein HOY80DRAFT_890268 [Tuber brumale]|nr:hypothetical protein HOY80DRAFT_890268 [Tuber brumale]
MTDKLPANLLALFAPRPPLRYLPHCDYAPDKRRTAPITGVAAYLEALRTPDPDYVPTESWMQRRDRLREEKKAAIAEKTKAAFVQYNPEHDPQVRGDPFKTLFLSRLNYNVKEPDLEREFGRFGPIERIRIVRDKETSKHRGYAFIVYEREKDMKAAYKETDGIRIKDRRVLVDVERGRTVKGWKPRRLGGGLGGRGYTKIPVTRPTGPSFFGQDGPRGPGGFGGRGGGFRGGYQGGGFRGGRGGGGFSGGNRFEVGGGRGPRGGIGYQGGDRGGRGHENGYHGGHGEAPPNAPTGPGGRRGGGGGGYGGGGGGYGDGGHRGNGGGGGYDRHRGGHDRESGSARDRFADSGRYSGHGRDDRHDDGGYSRKRAYDGGEGGYGGSGGGGGGDRHRRRY